jgi:hypothetical protein
MVVKGNQWAFRQHQQSKRCQAAQKQQAVKSRRRETYGHIRILKEFKTLNEEYNIKNY